MEEEDEWMKEHEAAQEAVRTARMSLEERAEAVEEGKDPGRAAGAARRKLNGLAARLDRLDELAQREGEPERGRRVEATGRLREQKRSLEQWLARGAGNVARGAKETEETAQRDERGLLQLQREHMAEQDKELDDLMTSTSSTKHVALAINQELGLHHRLLDDVEQGVASTHGRLRRALSSLRSSLSRRSSFRTILCSSLLLAALALALFFSLRH